MSFLDFVDKHPWLTFFLLFLILEGIKSIVIAWRKGG